MGSILEYFSTNSFMPHGHCILWRSDILWLHVISDLLIALSYYSIPLTLLCFVRKRRDLGFKWVFVLFGAFIFSCGTTHLFAIWNFWHSHYQLEGIVKGITAIASAITAVMVWAFLPKFFHVPNPTQLKDTNVELNRQIIERKKIEETLRRLNRTLEEKVNERTKDLMNSNKELQQFAYVASHDLQQPLRTIANFTELLRMRLEGGLTDETKEYFGLIAQGTARMQQLIKDLLAFAQISNSSRHFDQVDMEQVLASTISNLRTEIEEAAVRITHDPLPKVQGDSIQLQQLMQNLISNAIKYRCKEGVPHIHISSIENENQWSFTVADNGIGIKPEYFDVIFEMFRRLHTQQDYPGSGLGLAICRKIVQRHSGTIWLESESGVGSSFHFSLARSASTSLSTPQEELHV